MRQSEDDFTSHRIGLVPGFVDRKSGCAQEIEERLRVVALSENKKVHIVRGTWSPVNTECQRSDDTVGSLRQRQGAMG